MHQKHDEQENQACQHSPNYAHPPDPPVSTTGFYLVGVRPSPAPDSEELFDMTHKDVWKVLFKGAEVPPPLTEDHGLNVKRHANPISFYISQDIYFL